MERNRTAVTRLLGLALLGVAVGLSGSHAAPARGQGAASAGQSVALAAGAAPAQTGPAQPAPAGGHQLNGFLRIVDGDSIDALVDGRQTAIGIMGLDVPQLNTPCGKEAKDQLKALTSGGVQLEEEPAYTFDARKRHMYYLTRTADGKDAAKELIRGGFGHSDDRHGSKDKDENRRLEDDAKTNKRGCLWRDQGPRTDVVTATDPTADGPTAVTPSAPDQAPIADTSAAAAPDTAFAAASGAGLTSAAIAAGFTDDLVANGITNPTAFTFLPDGRILAAEKWGIVRVIKNGVLLPTPFIDLRSEVNDYWDRGMIGLAADPNFATNGFVWLLYTYENNAADYTGTKTARLTRITAAPPSSDTASPASETVILGTQVGTGCNQLPVGADCLPAEWVGHSVGAIRFAADGTIFLTNGDATTWNTVDDDGLRAQNLDSLAGKVLHITTSGQGLATNPFWTGNASANRSKIWAYGVRNAYRFGVRPSNGVPYVGDVGWGNWEEVDVALKGANLGWPCYEAHDQLVGYNTKPVCQQLIAQGPAAVQFGLIEYDHYPGGQVVSSAVTGGAFYTGTAYPSPYQGAYFYGDYARGFIRYALIDANNTLIAGPTDFTTGAGSPVDIQMGPDGNLWYLAINLNGAGGGEVHRFRYLGGPPPPNSPFLSDMPFSGTPVNGWGAVERDQSNGDLAGGDGRTISLRGTTYAKGLGTHANADIHYALAGACTRFASDIGVDDEVSGAGSVIFRVYLDGATTAAYDSGVMTGTSAAKQFSINVTGKNDLRLVVNDAGDGIDSDHADWANARVYCTGFSDTTAPTVSGTVPAAGASGVAIGAAVTASFSEALDPFTLTATTVSLVKQGTTTALAASLTYDGLLNKLTLQPTAALAAGTSYTATIKGGANGIKDLAGNALAADTVWSFSTNGNTPPTATIGQLTLNGTPTPAASLRYKVGDTIGFSGGATDPQDGTEPAARLSWQVIIHHCPGGSCHTHILTTVTGAASGSVVMPDHGDDSSVEIVLTATDSGGLQGTASTGTLQPQTVQLTLATSPAGLQLTYTTGSGADTVTGPTTRTTIVGSLHTVTAPSPQGSSTFTSWADGGAQQHNITIGAADTTITAIFGGCVTAGLAVDPATTAAVGTTLTLTGSSAGCSGTPQYRFWQYKAASNAWTIVQDYAAATSITLNTTGYSPGSYTFAVTVRSQGSALEREKDAYVRNYGLTAASGSGPCTTAALLVNPLSPQAVGTPLTLEASSSGCGGAPQYRFWQFKAAANAWIILQDYGAQASFALATSGYAAGGYTFAVTVRSQGSALEREKDAYLAYTLSAPGAGPCQSAALSVVPAGSASVGATLTLNGTSAGCGGVAQYRFWRYVAATNTWTILQDYGAAATLNLSTTGYAAGSYTFAVTVRSQASTLEREKDAYTPYTLN